MSSSRLAAGMLLAAAFSTAGFASSLQDWEFNVNGTTYYPAAGSTLSSVPGLNSSGFNSTAGLGTLTFTFNNGPGTYFIGGWFFDPVATPFYNEYGIVNNPGSLAAAESWQIDYPEYDGGGSPNVGAGTIVDNIANANLSNTNSVPGSTSNYLANCGGYGGGAANATCNDLVSVAIGFSFTVTSGNEEQVTLDLSSTDPGGFSVEDYHPVDGANTSAAAVFLSGSAVQVPLGGTPPPSTAPEPASWMLTALAGFVFLLFALHRRTIRT